MKILLVYPPIKNEVSHISLREVDRERGFLPPLGILYVGTYLREKSDFDVKVVDCNVDSISHSKILDVIAEFRPDIVGISSMTHFLVDAYKVAETIKKYSPYIITVVGGPHANIYPITTVKNKNVDYVIKGEGEVSFYKLACALAEEASEENISQIEGVATKLLAEQGIKDEDIKALKTPDLNQIFIPDRTLLPYQKYYSILSQSRPITTMITSRGCPFRCIFCDRMGKIYRSASTEYVVREIESILNLGIKEIFIHDDTFTVEKERVKAICQEIIKRKIKINWDARARVDCVNYDLLALMKEAGCKRISFGIESGNEQILKKLRKGISLAQAEEVFKWCRKLKIITLADFMVGSPGETMKEIQDTINFVKKIKPDYVQFSIVCPYPDTDLYRKGLKEGIIKEDQWLAFSENPSVNFMPPVWGEHFSRQELENITKKLYKQFYLTPHFIFKEMKKLKNLSEIRSKVRAGINLLLS